MKYIINREQILPTLQQIVNVIEKRQTMPILSNVLMKFENNQLTLTGTDLEIQLVSSLQINTPENLVITVPARKFLDICRLLPNNAEITLELKNAKLIITSGRGRYSLATLEASNYPEFSENKLDYLFSISAEQFKKALNKSLFCMANQDVRYYLNGLMVNISNNKFKLVASNGHRLGIYEGEIAQATGYEINIIIPRKGVIELSRLLDNPELPLQIQFSDSNIKVLLENLSFSAKLIDAQYPDFSKIFNQEFFDVIKVDRDILKDALTRVAVLTNEKIKGITLDLTSDLLKISTHNLEHDEAEEEVSINFSSDQALSIAFNAQYLLEAIANVDAKNVTLRIAKNASTCLIEDPNDPSYQYIVMPLRL
jgi:DNA polymerase-3 subunit beta